MRIIVNGQQAFGEAVLRALVERGENVVAVYCAPDKIGARPDPLKLAAESLGLPVYQPQSFKNPDVWAQMSALKPDLCVMAFVTKFVPSDCLSIPRLGTIQYHPSLLPRHRGPSAINWPIIQGETVTGLSIFWPDDGLDTGPILLQKTINIGPDDTLGTLYFDNLFPMGVSAMLESVDLVREGKAPRVEQDHTLSDYQGWCKAEDCVIDWAKPAQTVYNLIRGANPSPGASTLFKDESLSLYDARMTGSQGGKTGSISAVHEDGIVVEAGGGAILVQRLRFGKGPKEAATEWFKREALTIGTQLGS
jgi:methionyl-tRNA formyltransferase